VKIEREEWKERGEGKTRKGKEQKGSGMDDKTIHLYTMGFWEISRSICLKRERETQRTPRGWGKRGKKKRKKKRNEGGETLQGKTDEHCHSRGGLISTELQLYG